MNDKLVVISPNVLYQYKGVVIENRNLSEKYKYIFSVKETNYFSNSLQLVLKIIDKALEE